MANSVSRVSHHRFRVPFALVGHSWLMALTMASCL